MGGLLVDALHEEESVELQRMPRRFITATAKRRQTLHDRAKPQPHSGIEGEDIASVLDVVAIATSSLLHGRSQRMGALIVDDPLTLCRSRGWAVSLATHAMSCHAMGRDLISRPVWNFVE